MNYTKDLKLKYHDPALESPETADEILLLLNIGDDRKPELVWYVGIFDGKRWYTDFDLVFPEFHRLHPPTIVAWYGPIAATGGERNDIN